MSTRTDRLRSGRDSVLPPAGAPRDLAMAQLANSVGDGAFIVTSALFSPAWSDCRRPRSASG